jgi:mannitol/fructose-specific phosphotransferase system IIA component (Ntr-type)
MDLAKLVTRDTVKVPLEAFDKEEAIAELVEVLVRADRISDREGVLDKLYEREDKGSTGIGGGVAIPHAKHDDVDGVVLAVGNSPDGIEWESADDELVHLVFLVVAETQSPGPNVEVLADIGYLVQIPQVYQGMVSARDDKTLVEVVRNVEIEQ